MQEAEVESKDLAEVETLPIVTSEIQDGEQAPDPSAETQEYIDTDGNLEESKFNINSSIIV